MHRMATKTTRMKTNTHLVRATPTRRVLALLLLGALSAPAPASARLHAAVSLDDSTPKAAAVWIARVTRVQVVGKTLLGSTPIEHLDVHVRIEEALKGPSPAPATIRHLRVGPNPPPSINGYSFVDLQVGKTYLLFLQRDAARARSLVLMANEDSTHLVTLSAADLAAVRRLPRRSPVVERLVDLLADQLSRCNEGCTAAIWLLEHSQTHRQRIAAPAARQAFIAHLVRVSRKATHENDLNAAYTVLGQLDHRALLPELIARISAPQPAGRRFLQVNTVSWLQGYPTAVQVDALRKVARGAKDAPTRKAAAERIQHLGGKP